MFKVFQNILKDKKGDGYVDVVVLVLIAMMVIALAVKVYPAFIVKDQLNTLANEILRESQIQGKIDIDYNYIVESIGTDVDTVTWEANTFSENKVQLDDQITVTCIANVEIGLFGDFGSFSIPLRSKATGKSEVYWKE